MLKKVLCFEELLIFLFRGFVVSIGCILEHSQVLCLKALLFLTFKGLLLALVVYRDTCAAFKRTANILIQGFSVEVLKRALC